MKNVLGSLLCSGNKSSKSHIFSALGSVSKFTKSPNISSTSTVVKSGEALTIPALNALSVRILEHLGSAFPLVPEFPVPEFI